MISYLTEHINEIKFLAILGLLEYLLYLVTNRTIIIHIIALVIIAIIAWYYEKQTTEQTKKDALSVAL